MFKKILQDTLKIIKEREESNNNIMDKCVQDKLDNTFNYYKITLEDTCKYILSRNPIVMLKDLNTIRQEDEEGE